MSTFSSQASGFLSRRLSGRLRKLVTINVETGERFKELVQYVTDPNLAYEFREWSLDRRANSTELRELLGVENAPPSSNASTTAKEGELWLPKLLARVARSKRRAASSDAQMALLEETDVIEGQVKREYEEALRVSRGTPLLRILQSQYLGVKAVQDKTRRFLAERRDPH